MQKNHLKSRELAYLESHGAKDLSTETARAIAQRRVILSDEPLYARVKVGKAGIQNLLSPDLFKKVGVTNIDRQRLPKFINFIIDSIRLGYASALPADNKKAEEVTYSSKTEDVPVALRHALFVVKQNEKSILSLPVKFLLQQEKMQAFEGEIGYQIKYPRMLKEEIGIQVSIEFPENASLPDNLDHFIEFYLNGTATDLRNSA